MIGTNFIEEFFTVSNILTIIIGAISLLVAYYLYFKTFFRLIYSVKTICETCNKMEDWHNEETVFKSRVIFYNNGRKSLSKNEIVNLKISSSDNEIKTFRLLKDSDEIKVKSKLNVLQFDFNFFDAKKYFVIELEHKGIIQVDGRVLESGKILHEETKFWFWFSIIVLFIVTCSSFVVVYRVLSSTNPSFSGGFGQIFLLIGLFLINRIVKKLFFIPEGLILRYLGSNDKAEKSFKNQFKIK